MGEIAQRFADLVVITAEDPRGQFKKITEQILKGSLRAGGKMDKNLFVKEDRLEAISFAIDVLAKRGDIIGIFGKGHEKSMNLDGKKEIPWSDREAILRALR
jgi:UDP-N-acetylmuramoyl-L-alanyl-D-glutamate--2,6-diaminopimelate ligase